MEKRVRPIAESMNAKMCMECDVTNEEAVKAVFEEYAKNYDSLDFVVHAVAFANKEDEIQALKLADKYKLEVIEPMKPQFIV